MKKLLVVLAIVAAGCSHNSLTGPSAFPSAGGTLPAWIFGQADNPRVAGHLVQLPDGVYAVAFGAGVASDTEVSAFLDQLLTVVSTWTDGRIRFVRTDRKDVFMSFSIDSATTPDEGTAGNVIAINPVTFIPISSHIVFKDRSVALSDAALHEIGHTLFCGGHSDDPHDVMARGIYRTTGGRMSFSAHESEIWFRARVFPPGTTP
jgi:hypothetical protein